MKLLARTYTLSRIRPSHLSQKCTDVVTVPDGEKAQNPEGLASVIQVGWQVLGYDRATGKYLRTTPVTAMWYREDGSIGFSTQSGSEYILKADSDD